MHPRSGQPGIILFFLCRFVPLSVLQEAEERRPLLQPVLLPVSRPARAPAGQQQRPSAGRGERNRLQGVFTFRLTAGIFVLF